MIAPASPRTTLRHAAELDAKDDLAGALAIYAELLAEDSRNHDARYEAALLHLERSRSAHDGA